jgi:O-methyltransferase
MLRGLKNRLRGLRGDAPAPGNGCLRVGVRFVCWNQVPGDFLEFGCGSGRSFIESYDLFRSTRASVAAELNAADRATFERTKPRFFAFDSYQGLPDVTGVDQHPYRPLHWKKSEYAFSVESFKAALQRAGVVEADVRIVDGWFGDTLTGATRTRHELSRAALVHVDCDYYESAVLVLDFVTDLVQDGTVIVFDDYNFFRGSPRLGERRAFSEWLERNPQLQAIELARHDFSSTAFYLTSRA